MTAAEISGSATKVIAARSALAEHGQAVRELDTRIQDLRNRAAGAQAEFDDLITERNARNLAATLADEPIPDQPPAEGARLRNLQAQIDASKAAASVLEGDRIKLLAHLPELKRSMAEALLAWKAYRLRSAVENAKRAIASLHEPVAELFALQAIQEEILGPKFEISRGTDRDGLASADALASRFLSGLPERLKPDVLSSERLDLVVSDTINKFKVELAND